MKLAKFLENVYLSGFPNEGFVSIFIDETTEIEYKKLKSNSHIFNNPLIRIRLVFKESAENAVIDGFFDQKPLRVKREPSEDEKEIIFTSKLYRGKNVFRVELNGESWDLVIMHKSLVRDWVEGLARAVIVIVGLNTFIVQGSYIPSASMMNTLVEGDFIWVNKAAYRMHEPKRGDVVVFNFPLDPSRDFIKRLIGLPGDTLRVQDKIVYLNGKPLKEDYVIYSSSYDIPPVEMKAQDLTQSYMVPIKIPKRIWILGVDAKFKFDEKSYFSRGLDASAGQFMDLRNREVGRERTPLPILASEGDMVSFGVDGSLSVNGKLHPTGSWKMFALSFLHLPGAEISAQDVEELTVPEGSYFVMGDNRDNSLDSRYWGLVPEHSMKGKALFLYFPLTRMKLISSVFGEAVEQAPQL